MMRKAFIHSVAMVCFFLVSSASRSNAAISVYIFPDINQNPVFEISGQFDGLINGDFSGLIGFSFGPHSICTLPPIPAPPHPFTSPLGTIVDLTRGGSADIVGFSPGIYSYFNLSEPLPISAGDSLELISHGPISLAGTFFRSFLQGDYNFSNPDLGPTTFETQIVPEPTSLIIIWLGLAAFAIFQHVKAKNAI